MTREEWEKLPESIRYSLMQQGFDQSNLTSDPKKIPGAKPYTAMGAHSTGEYAAPSRANFNAATIHEANGDDKPSLRSSIVHNTANPGPDTTLNRAHEYEHALQNQGLGDNENINGMWDTLIGKRQKDQNKWSVDDDKSAVVKRLVAHSPYLVEMWGLPKSHADTGYFSKTVLERPDRNAFMQEQMATLSALEQAKNKRFTDDPYVQKNILTSPAQRETYNALTGLRQTRLDAKDLPPYTRQPEPAGPQEPGFMDKIKAQMKAYGLL